MTEKDCKNLEGVHPLLIAKLTQVLEYMATVVGKPMKPAGKAVRTTKEQQALYRQGRPGGPPGSKIVTYADGVKNKSNHQVKADGFGHAVDLCFVDDPRTPKDETWDEALWQHEAPKMWAKAKEVGLKVGADWKKPDRPHVELPEEV